MKNFRVHPTHWLISTQLGAEQGVARGAKEERGRAAPRGARHGPEVVERDAGALAHASTPNPHLACPLCSGDHGAFVKKNTQYRRMPSPIRFVLRVLVFVIQVVLRVRVGVVVVSLVVAAGEPPTF